MKKALIIMSSNLGHYNASFGLSQRLMSMGVEITYAGALEFKQSVELHGFGFKEFYYIHTFNDYKKYNWKLFLKTFKSSLSSWLTDLRFKRFKAEISFLTELVDSSQYDFIFVDSFLFLHSLVLYKYRDRIILVETMMSRSQQNNIPPLNHKKMSFKINIVNVWYVKLQWRCHHLQINFDMIFENFVYFNQSHFKLAKRFLLSEGIKKCFFYNLKDVREIVLSPIGLDFSWRKISKNQFHFAIIRNLERPDVGLDPDYLSMLRRIRKKKSKNIKVIYCSLGSLAPTHFNGYERFLTKVSNIYKDSMDRLIIISTGNDAVTNKLKKERTPNVFVFSKIPQIEVLKYSDLFITHAGLNSIIESILTNTPVLMYPLNRRWDQIGNSDRMIHHHIGLEGNIRRDSEKDIRKSAEYILHNEEFKNSIQTLKNTFKSGETHDDGLIDFLMG
jgi:zeaxanthin glucosyltransferase